MAIETSEIDWSNDEAVVRTRWPQAHLSCHATYDSKAEMNGHEWLVMGTKSRKGYSYQFLGKGLTREAAWADARKEAAVVAFESTLRVQDAPEVVREAEGKCGHKLEEDGGAYSCIRPKGHEGLCSTVLEPVETSEGGVFWWAETPAANPLFPDQFEEWFANTFPGLLTLIAKENCSSYGVAKSAWNAALSSTRPEGEAKVTWKVIAQTLEGDWYCYCTATSEDDAHRIVNLPARDYLPGSEHIKRSVKIETYETVIETRKKEA